MDKIQVLNDSRMARLVYDSFKSILDKQRSDLGTEFVVHRRISSDQ